MAEEVYLIAGLGNPGSKYENTRHNVGFQVVDALANAIGIAFDVEKWETLLCRAQIANKRVYLLKPQTYMNLSGKSLARFADFYKVPTNRILVLHDDLDMHPGRLKMVATGGPGGHNGIKSIIQCLGSKEFFRLKIGIGRPGQNGVHPKIPVERFVLASFSNEEQRIMDERMEVLLDGVRLFVESGAEKAMNLVNAVK